MHRITFRPLVRESISSAKALVEAMVLMEYGADTVVWRNSGYQPPTQIAYAVDSDGIETQVAIVSVIDEERKESSADAPEGGQVITFSTGLQVHIPEE